MEQDFGRRLRQLREKAGLSQGKLSRLADLSLTTICKLEQRGGDPAWSTVVKLARGLGVSTEAFLAEEKRKR